ncbi:MAG: winged helix-turn-helix domain-containing protein [Vicinamibacteria bacterium]
MSTRGPQVTNERRRFDEFASRPLDPQGASPPIEFGRFLLDPETGRLLEAGQVVPLPPKPFETLYFLASRHGRVVSKTELMAAIWPGTFVTEDVLVQCVVEIRRALGDHARSPEFVATIPRRGYQFLAEARVARTPASIPGTREPPPPAQDVRDSGTAARGAAGRRARVVPALGALLALVIAGLVTLRFGLRPADVSPPPTVAGSLLVVPVRVESPTAENRWLQQGLAELIRSELVQAPGISVVARHRLAAVLPSASIAEGAAPTAAQAQALARRLGAERVVMGSFVGIEDRFVLTAQLVHTASGREEAQVTARGRYPAELMDAVDQLCRQLLDGAPLVARESAGREPIRLATRSVDAYRQYTEALAWFARGGRRGADEAERRLDEAVRLDSEFAYAYLKKAEIQIWRQRFGYGTPDAGPAIRAAAALASRLPQRERLLVETMAALPDGDVERALSRAQALLRLFPNYAEEVGLPRLLADLYYSLGRWDDLITLGAAHVDSPSLPADERAGLAALLSKAYRQKGEPARALFEARRAVRLWPASAGPSLLRQRNDLGRACLDAGRRHEALAEFRATSSAREADVTNLTDAGWGLYMAGEAGEATALVERALALDRRYGNAYHLRGWLRLASGDPAGAAPDFERAYDMTPTGFGAAHLGFVGGDLAALYYAGVAYQKLGDRARAQRTLRRVIERARAFEARAGASASARFEAGSLRALAAVLLGEAAPEPPRLEGDDATWYLQSARLHALQGRAEALRDLSRALALAPGERQHVSDDPNFDALRSDPEFRRLTEAR